MRHRPLCGARVDAALGEHCIIGGEHNGDTFGVLLEELWVGVDVDDDEPHPAAACVASEERKGLGTEPALVAGHEAQHIVSAHDPTTLVLVMRPVTAIVLLGLLAIIVGAFLWQLYLADAVL